LTSDALGPAWLRSVVRRHERVYEKARIYFVLDSDGYRVMSAIAILLCGVGMLGRGLLMLHEKKRGWQPWVIVGVFLLVATLFGWI